ncbi:MAG: glycosyltransferase, partial [Anaerolineaceae bacterium]
PCIMDARMKEFSQMKKRILILTADAGYGHRSAANALAQSFDMQYGSACECRIVNPVFEKSAPVFLRNSQLNYDRTVMQSPGFYRFTYEASDSMEISALVHQTMGMLLYKSMREMVTDYRPDAVITTYHSYEAAFDAVKASKKMKTPFFCVVTDLTNVHKLWFRRTPDRLFVGSDTIQKEAIACGYPPEKITVSGIPVNPAIAHETRSKPEIRRSLGWDESLPTLLIIGSRRVQHLAEDLRAIQSAGLPLQVAVITGGDDEQYQQLHQTSWKMPVYLYPFVKNVPEMMLAADMLASKAGGLVIAEGLACGLPILLIDALPGQEAGNVDFVCNNRVGQYVPAPDDLTNALQNWLAEDQRRMKEFSSRAGQFGKPHAADQIARMIWEAAQLQPQSYHQYPIHRGMTHE